jgi:hypothetical protein
MASTARVTSPAGEAAFFLGLRFGMWEGEWSARYGARASPSTAAQAERTIHAVVRP